MELLCRVDICIPAAARYWQKHFAPFMLPAKRGRPQTWQVDGAGFWHSQTIQGSSVSTAEVCRESTKMDVGTNVTFYRTVVILYCLSKGAPSHQPLPWHCRLWTQHQLCFPPSTEQEPLPAPVWLFLAAAGPLGGSNPTPVRKPSSPGSPFPIQTNTHPPRHLPASKSPVPLLKNTHKS